MAWPGSSSRSSSGYFRPPVPTTVLSSIQIFRTRLDIVHGDITNEDVGAITNAANEELWLGGGVAGAINEKAGPAVDFECKQYIRERGKVRVGQAVYTSGGNLRCPFIIHAVGPTYKQGQPNEDMLHQTIVSILHLAEELCLESIAIPAISSGIYGYPPNECALVMFTVLGEYLQATVNTSLRLVRFTNIDRDTVRYRQVDYFTQRLAMMRDTFTQLDAFLSRAASSQLPATG